MLGNHLKIKLILCLSVLFIVCEDRRSAFVFDEVTLEYQADDQDLMAAFGETFYLQGTDQPFDGKATMKGAMAPKMVWTFEEGKVKQVDSYNVRDVRLRSNVYEDGHTIASRTWYESGELWVEWSKESGFTREYYESGQLKSEVPWSDKRVIDGTVKLYDEEGNLVEQHEYVNGVKMKSEVLEEGTTEE
jgi:hypothetical protein